MITRKNYELYFIDYMEGNLSDQETVTVDVFLSENPDLQEELAEFSSIPIMEAEEKVTLDFSYLKKQSLIDETNEEDFFIGKLEGDLNKEELKLLSLYLKENPEKSQILESFQRTKLTPEVLLYPNKRSLKRTRQIGSYYYLTSGVAACILALLYFNISLDVTEETPLTAQKNEYKISLDKLNEEKVEGKNILQVEERDFKLPKKSGLMNLAKQSIKEEFTEPKKALNKKDKIEVEYKEPKKKEIKFKEEFNKELLAMNLVPEPSVLDKKMEKTKTIREYAKEKSINFIVEKTTGKKDESESLLAFASKKAAKIPLPKLIDYNDKKTEKQQVRTIKIGKLFSIKRKSRI